MTNLELLNALACSRYKTCYFSDNVEETSGLKIFIKITDHFTRTPANLINCITCPYCNKFYISETERRQGDRFWEHRDVERDVKDASNQSPRHFDLPNHSKQYMEVCGCNWQPEGKKAINGDKKV